MSPMQGLLKTSSRSDPFSGRDMLFCVGAQKAGTTWLYKYLSEHPDVHVPMCKELHYFDNIYGAEKGSALKRRYDTIKRFEARGKTVPETTSLKGLGAFPSPAWMKALVHMHENVDDDHSVYKAMMTEGAGRARYLADITPAYCLTGEEGFREMLRLVPHAKFLFIMRDPVSRFWSAVRMGYNRRLNVQKRKSNGTEIMPPERMVRQAMNGRGGSQFVRRAHYSEAVRIMDKVVPEAQRMYLFYENLFSDETIEKLSAFLGIPPRPGDFSQKVFEGTPRKLRPRLKQDLRAFLDDEYVFAEQRFGSDLPDAWRKHDAAMSGDADREMQRGYVS